MVVKHIREMLLNVDAKPGIAAGAHGQMHHHVQQVKVATMEQQENVERFTIKNN